MQSSIIDETSSSLVCQDEAAVAAAPGKAAGGAVKTPPTDPDAELNDADLSHERDKRAVPTSSGYDGYDCGRDRTPADPPSVASGMRRSRMFAFVFWS